MTGRTIGAAMFGAFVGGWIGRAVFKWILDVPGDWQIVLILAAAVVGAVVCIAGEHETRAGASEE